MCIQRGELFTEKKINEEDFVLIFPSKMTGLERKRSKSFQRCLQLNLLLMARNEKLLFSDYCFYGNVFFKLFISSEGNLMKGLGVRNQTIPE